MLNTLVSLIISICLLSGNPVYVVDADWSANYIIYDNSYPMVYSVEYHGYIGYKPIKEVGYQGAAYFQSQNYLRECGISSKTEYDGVVVYHIGYSYKDKCKSDVKVKSWCSKRIKAKCKSLL